MNIVSIRETAKELHKAEVLNDRMFKLYLECPVFYIPVISGWKEEEIEWVKNNIAGGDDQSVPINAPYRNFIIHIPKSVQYIKADGTLAPVGECENSNIYVNMNRLIAPTRTHGKMQCIFSCFKTQHDSDDGNDYWLFAGFTGQHKDGALFQMWRNGKQHDVLDHKRDAIQEEAHSIRNLVARVCYDVMSRTSAVVRVEPKPRPDKPIAWHQARTHYCILTKKQAMQIRDRRGGITNHSLTRAAHWRRAHFRTLTSDKFTHKKGQRIPVVEAWVGPESWAGTDGKIYTVMPN